MYCLCSVQDVTESQQNGGNLLDMFYKEPNRWAYTFQVRYLILYTPSGKYLTVFHLMLDLCLCESASKPAAASCPGGAQVKKPCGLL